MGIERYNGQGEARARLGQGQGTGIAKLLHCRFNGGRAGADAFFASKSLETSMGCPLGNVAWRRGFWRTVARQKSTGKSHASLVFLRFFSWVVVEDFRFCSS